jgi:hypothetical protein
LSFRVKKIYAQFIERALAPNIPSAKQRWPGVFGLEQRLAKREKDSLRVDATLYHLAKRAFFAANRSVSTQRLGLK